MAVIFILAASRVASGQMPGLSPALPGRPAGTGKQDLASEDRGPFILFGMFHAAVSTVWGSSSFSLLFYFLKEKKKGIEALLGSQLGVGKNLSRWFQLCILSTLVSLRVLPTGAVRGVHVGAGRYSGSREALKGPRSCPCPPASPPGSHPGFPPAELSAVTRRPPGLETPARRRRPSSVSWARGCPGFPLSPWPAELPRFPRKVCSTEPGRREPHRRPASQVWGLDGWKMENPAPKVLNCTRRNVPT